MNPNAITPWAPSAKLQAQIDRLTFDLKLTQPARDYLASCMTGGPSRQVQGRQGNVITRFHSPKMETSILLESRRGEHAYAVLLERNPSVHVFFAQPPQVHLQIKDESGRVTTTTPYTPDFLSIRDGEIVVTETRNESKLFDRMDKNPHQFYVEMDTGKWHYRAAEEFYASLGFRYELISNSSLPARLIENTRFLEDYASVECPPLKEEERTTIVGVLRDKRFVALREVLDAGISADIVFKAITEHLIYVDLTVDRLAATGDMVLFVDEPTHRAHQMVAQSALQPALPIPGTIHLRAGSEIRFSNRVYTVLLPGERDVLLQDEQGNQITRSFEEISKAHKAGLLKADGIRNDNDVRRLADYSSEDLARAAKRLKAVREGRSDSFSDRSITRFRGDTAHAQNELDALIALVDNQRSKGNRESRVSEMNLELIEKAVEQQYNTPDRPTKKGAYAKYQGSCEGKVEGSGQPVNAISYGTFCRYTTKLTSTTKREGRRAAYQKSAIVQALESSFPAHGVRPYEVCYIDHTTANISLISPNGSSLGKPTLTIGVDGNTTHPRALVLSYDPPSARTVLLLMRDFVQRHGRLPRVIVADNGKEFHSKELEHFCKMYGIEIRYRGPGMPRGGAMIERLLGASEEEVLSEMVGNTRSMKTDTRLITKSVDPFRRSAWTLPGTYGALEEYLFKVRPSRIHPALGVTPDEFQEARLKETGARDFRGVHLTEDFLLMTSPHARRPFHKVDRQRGVWVDGLWYRHPAMKDVRKSEKVEVRIEPWNASVIYVYIRDRWVAATGTNTRWLAGRTHREVEIALREEQRRAKLNANKDSVSKRSLKHKDKPWLPEAFDPRLAEQQREMQALYGPKGLTTAMPLPADVAAGVNSDSAATAAAEPAASKPAATSPEQTAPAVSNTTPPAPSVQESQDAEPANESSYAALLRARAHYR